ncbi:MAG: hypothetical protein GXY84_05150 [Clostridiales bacterium]|nr:hypothetical protein [Clostridiales bacterium]
MDQFEMVEKLRQKANVSYEEARTALERNGWDLLDALVDLEAQGKTRREEAQSYTTRKEEPKQEQARDLRGGFARLFAFLGQLINKAGEIHLDVSRDGKVLFSLPLLVVALLLVFLFWWVVSLTVASLFFGLRYRFRGHQVTEGMNRAMDKAARTAQSIVTGISRDADQKNQDKQSE